MLEALMFAGGFVCGVIVMIAFVAWGLKGANY